MKRGGSKPAYADQFNLLSPCYKDGEQPAGWHFGGVKTKPKKVKTTKSAKGKALSKKKPGKSKQKGGSTCYASPSVSEMGIYDKPESLEPSYSELAWNKRMTGGETGGETKPGTGNGGPKNGNGNGGPKNGNGTGNRGPKNGNNFFNLPGSVEVGNNSPNTVTKNNKLNNVSTYVKKVSGVVFEKENTSSGFAIIVEKTKEDPLNSKNDRYTIKVIEKTNPPSMSVLSDQQYFTISQTVRDTASKVFPLKKQLNNKGPVVNYSISNENGIANANSAKAANTANRTNAANAEKAAKAANAANRTNAANENQANGSKNKIMKPPAASTNPFF